MDWNHYVVIDSRYFRPKEVDFLLGDPAKAGDKLKWQPKVNLGQLVKIMVECDMKLAEKEALLKGL